MIAGVLKPSMVNFEKAAFIGAAWPRYTYRRTFPAYNQSSDVGTHVLFPTDSRAPCVWLHRCCFDTPSVIEAFNIRGERVYR